MTVAPFDPTTWGQTQDGPVLDPAEFEARMDARRAARLSYRRRMVGHAAVGAAALLWVFVIFAVVWGILGT